MRRRINFQNTIHFYLNSYEDLQKMNYCFHLIDNIRYVSVEVHDLEIIVKKHKTGGFTDREHFEIFEIVKKAMREKDVNVKYKDWGISMVKKPSIKELQEFKKKFR